MLELGSSVSGHLMDTRENSLPGARIRMTFAEPPDGSPPFVRHTTPPDWITTGVAGAFQFAPVPTGDYHFEVDAGAGVQRARNESMSVASGVALDGIEVTIESTSDRGHIEGHVVEDTSNSPFSGFSLRVISVDSPYESSPRLGELSIEPDGTFRIAGVSPGAATLEFSADGHASERIQVDVQSEQTKPIRVPSNGKAS